MSNSDESTPSGTSEAHEVELGEPMHDEPGRRPREERHPDLDARQRRIPTTRKPAGPAPRRPRDLQDADVPESTQGPTDPELEGR
jgi:hypothetical protein